MIDTLRSLAVRIGDGLLEWVLMLHRDVSVIALGLISACVLVVLRLATTDRGRLGVISGDEQRLRELRRTARRKHDRVQRARLRSLQRLVALQRARAEWKYLAAAVLFLTALVTWGTARLEFLPVYSDHSLQFVVRVSAANPDDVAHLVPQPGVTALDGWIRPLETTNGELTAVWRLTIEGADSSRTLVARFRDQTIEHPVLVGGTRYLPPACQHVNGTETELLLIPYDPLGLLPPRVAGLPTWMLMLTVVTAGSFLALRRLWRIP